jgi:2-polyprenyl-3-methyl-5-hydroxy-6-metoxy-1,4-benzoquinol methylase
VSAVATATLGADASRYLEEVNEGVLREFQRLKTAPGRVLDVGCGRGALGQAIQHLGWEVWGIEQNAEVCATARQRLDRVIEADLLDVDQVRPGLGAKAFDAVVFSDVLEHLIDPLAVVESYVDLLKPGGKVIVSVPNAVVWTNRLAILCGWVEYTDSGVMDRTHLRFFTFRSAKRLIRQSGLRLDRVSSTPHLVRALLPMIKTWFRKNDGHLNARGLLDSRAYRAYLQWIYPVEQALASLWRGMFAFRIILVATKPA